MDQPQPHNFADVRDAARDIVAHQLRANGYDCHTSMVSLGAISELTAKRPDEELLHVIVVPVLEASGPTRAIDAHERTVIFTREVQLQGLNLRCAYVQFDGNNQPVDHPIVLHKDLPQLR